MTITCNTWISQLKKRSTYIFSLKTTKNNYLFLYLEGERMGQPSFDAPSEWNAWTCKRKKKSVWQYIWDMRLFTLDNQVQICDCLTSFFVSSLLPIKFFISTVDVLKTNFQNIYSVMNSNGTCFEQNRTSRSHTSNDHAVTIDLEGFTISLRFLCVIRSPLRFSTARTNITHMFLSIVETKVEEFWLKNASSRVFPKAEPWLPASSYVPFDQRSENKPVCAVRANGLPDKRCRRLAWSVSGGW